MAPGPKRKRGDARSYSQDNDYSGRPSPHRPQDLSLAGGSPQHTNSFRGGRRGSRGGGRANYSGAHSSGAVHASPTTMAPLTNTFQPTKPTPSTPSTPAPQREPPFQPSSHEVPDTNDYLTPERVANWNTEARAAVIEAATRAQQDGEMTSLNMVYLEMIDAAAQQYMPPVEIGTMVRDIIASPTDRLVDPVSCFLDCTSTYTEEHAAHMPIQKMLAASEIDPARMRSELEGTLLIGLDLVRPSFPKVAVRKATNALYRQTNYNLLREESEGFSKLITEYFTTVSSGPPTDKLVSDTFQRVNALIGAFDLDVGRVLDVTLDVFANLLVRHYTFFVKYLRASDWWPKLLGIDGVEWEEPELQTLPDWALPTSQIWYYTDEQKAEQLLLRESRDVKFWQRMTEIIAKSPRKDEKEGIKAYFELGARRVIRNLRDTDNTIDSSKSAKKTLAQEWAEKWIAETGTLPPLGNDIAAQLLGFKLKFYASNTRDNHDVLPDNLIYLAALLIKIGFISITDLYPHLYPSDADMSTHRAKLEKEQKEKEAQSKGKATNALATAGALPDDTIPAPTITRLRESESKPSSKPESERSTPAKSEEETKAELPEPADQKVALLRSLLCIGAIPEAFFIIGRYRWLLNVYPDLHPYIFRLAHHSLSKVYDYSRPVPLDKVPSTTKGANSGTQTRASDFVPRKTLRWAKPELQDAGEGVDYRFYWEDWSDNVPICQTVDDVFLLCNSMLGLVGPECGRDIMLMTKLARIGKKSITEDPSPMNMTRWSDLTATFLAPALTFTGQNPGVINEMWELVKRFDTATRYKIYNVWFSMTKPAMRKAFADVEHETKRLLGKVATTNTRPMGRAMAKLAYSCPGVVFKQTLRQGQNYINMIEALVECSRYLTNLGYDCLTWALINSILSSERPTLQGDGMLIKGWLKNTAIFVGKVYQRYGLMDPTPILQLVNKQLLDPKGDLFMMTVLEQLVTSMGGVTLSGALTEARVIALSAGPHLRSYTLEHHLGDRRHKTKVSARRLLKCLKESSLAPPMLIALSRQIQCYLFRPELLDVPDKVVFTNFDNLRSSFGQFSDYLRENLSVTEFDNLFPNVVELMSLYHLDTSLAFHISRDSIAVKANATRLRIVTTPASEDVVMQEASNSKDFSEGSTGVDTKDADMKDAMDATSAEQNITVDSSNSDTKSRPNPEIEALASKLRAALPKRFGQHPFLQFLVTFWQLSTKDVYQADGSLLKQQYEDTKQRLTANPNTGDRRKDAFIIRQGKEDAAKLSEEYDTFTEQLKLIQSGIQEEMPHWFPGIPMMEPTLHTTLLQDCFLPRSRLSLQDAQFSSSMLFFMHRSGVPGFRSSKLLDELFNIGKLSALIFMMSEDESKCFARFLNDILRELGQWHESEDTYTKMALGPNRNLPGFGRQFNAEGRPLTFLNYDEFRAIHFRWHKQLWLALTNCMKGGQYIQLRNSINILKAVSPAFPKVDDHGRSLRDTIKRFAEEDERNDIKVAANSLLFEFKRSGELWKTQNFFTTVSESRMYWPTSSLSQGKDKLKEVSPGPASSAASSKTSEAPDSSSNKLNAAATSFQSKVSDT